MKQQKTVYRSMQGKEVDMYKLQSQNEITVAVSNVKINARGDELGPGGKIIRKVVETVSTDQVIPAQSNTPPTAPVIIPEQTAKPTKPALKNVAGMDPAGNE